MGKLRTMHVAYLKYMTLENKDDSGGHGDETKASLDLQKYFEALILVWQVWDNCICETNMCDHQIPHCQDDGIIGGCR